MFMTDVVKWMGILIEMLISFEGVQGKININVCIYNWVYLKMVHTCFGLFVEL